MDNKAENVQAFAGIVMKSGKVHGFSVDYSPVVPEFDIPQDWINLFHKKDNREYLIAFSFDTGVGISFRDMAYELGDFEPDSDYIKNYNKFIGSVTRLNESDVEAILLGIVHGDNTQVTNDWRKLNPNDGSISDYKWEEPAETIKNMKASDTIKAVYSRM